MRYQAYLAAGDRSEWLKLEVTLGSNETIIDRELQAFKKFLNGFDPTQRAAFTQITGIDISADTSGFSISDKISLQSLMLKKFTNAIGISVLQEATGGMDSSEEEMYLSLLTDLIQNSKYPHEIYAYSVYRGRGTPTTWLSISDEYTAEQIEATIDTTAVKIVRSINHRLSLSRKLVSTAKINGLVIYLLLKPTAPRVHKAEHKNVEVPGASYSLLVLDVTNKKIGIVSGSKKEVQVVQTYLRHRTFNNALAAPRNDVRTEGKDVLKKLLKPDESDPLVLQGMELRKTALPETPSLKIRVQGTRSIDESLVALESYWQASSVSDLRQADFLMPTGKVDSYKKIGLYTYGDEWNRTCINTSTKNITTLIESQFLELIKTRLGGTDIKETKFVLSDLSTEFIVEKLIKDKVVSTSPPIPADAEKVVVELTNKKLIVKQESTVKRKCWNCYATSWDQWACPNCGRDNMRIVSEAIRIVPNETVIIRTLSKLPDFPADNVIKYHAHKQRNNHVKSVMSVYNPARNITTFIVSVSKKQDVAYVENLSEEGFGVVALVDPKMEGRRPDIENAGCTAVNLTDILVYLIGKSGSNPLLAAITAQEDLMLPRIFTNTQRAIARLNAKIGYGEAQFEVDLKRLMQALVPDVIRLGTEFTGTSVPDGYSRYGSRGNRSSNRNKRLFGWDAKYSQTATYSLGDRDVIKQKKYIDWLMNPSADPSQFGKLGIYAIIANFDDPRRMHGALVKMAEYSKLKKTTRIALIEDMLLVKICEWLIAHWQQVIENNSVIADEVFKWFRRKQTKPYTVSKATDWPRLEAKLNNLLQ